MARKFWSKVKEFAGIETVIEEDEDVVSNENNIIESKSFSKISSSNNVGAGVGGTNNIVNMHKRSQMKVFLYKPHEVEDAKEIADNLKNGKPVIMDLNDLECDVAKQIFDFSNGVIYALGGDVQRISGNIFILAPHNINVFGDVRKELEKTGILPWIDKDLIDE